MSLTWRDALKKFNDERSANGGGKYTIPKKAPLNMNRSRLYKTPPFKRTLRRKEANQKLPLKRKT